MSVSVVVRRAALLALLSIAVVILNITALHLGPSGYTIDVGSYQDQAALLQFHGPERNAAGTSYRWSNPSSTLVMRGPQMGIPAVIELGLGSLPPGALEPRELTLSLDGATWTMLELPNQPRQLRLLLPPGLLADGEVAVGLKSATTIAPGDGRPVGVFVDQVGLRWFGRGLLLPVPSVLVAQIGLLLIWLALAHHLALRPLWSIAIAALMLAALILNALHRPDLAPTYQIRLLGGGLVSALLIWGLSRGLPHAIPEASPRVMKLLLLITLATLTIRLAGILYPLFFSHDLAIHLRRLRDVQFGRLLLVERPYEFDQRVILLVPSLYLLLLPATLLVDRITALQLTYALVEATTPLLVGVLALRLGLSGRVALLAAVLIALLPMNLTALHWGFAQQILAQWLALLLLVVMAGPAPRRALGWAGVVLLMTVTLLFHVGTFLLIGVCLSLLLLLGLWPRLRAIATGHLPIAQLFTAAEWRGWALSSAAAAGMAFFFHYIDQLRTIITSLLNPSVLTLSRNAAQSDQLARLQQVWVGLNASFAPLPVGLTLAGALALLWRVRGQQLLLVVAWLATTLIFLTVDMVTGQQVRYGYFSAPIILTGIALLLGNWLHRPVGRIIVWALIALVLIAGLQLWYTSIYLGIKPSINPLTH